MKTSMAESLSTSQQVAPNRLVPFFPLFPGFFVFGCHLLVTSYRLLLRRFLRRVSVVLFGHLPVMRLRYFPRVPQPGRDHIGRESLN